MISKRFFDSLGLTRIYTCQRGMSARCSVGRSRSSTFFSRSPRDAPAICHPLAAPVRSARVRGEELAPGSWVVGLCRSRRVLLGPDVHRAAGADGALACTGSRSHDETHAINRHDNNASTTRRNGRLMTRARRRRFPGATTSAALGCWRQRRSHTDARTDLRLRRTYATPGTARAPHLPRRTRLLARRPCYTFDFQRCMNESRSPTRPSFRRCRGRAGELDALKMPRSEPNRLGSVANFRRSATLKADLQCPLCLFSSLFPCFFF